MARCRKHGIGNVLFAGGQAGDTAAAAALAAVGIDRQALDIAHTGHGIDALLLFDQVFDVDLVLDMRDLGAALVAILFLDLQQAFADDLVNAGGLDQNIVIIGDLGAQLIQFVLDLLALEALQSSQLHLEDRLGLDLADAKAVHQVFLGVVVAVTDDMDNFVDVVAGNGQTFEDMGTVLRLLQQILGTVDDNIKAEVEIMLEALLEGEDLGLVVDQCQHIDREVLLHLGQLEELVEHDLRIDVLAHLDDNAHTLAVGLITDVGDTLNTLVLVQIGNVLDQTGLIDLIGQLGDDDAETALFILFDLGAGANGDLALAGGIGSLDAGTAKDDAACGEVGALDAEAQLVQTGFGIVDQAADAVDDLAQVVGRDIGGHTNSDTAGTVDQQLGEAGGDDRRLLQLVIEVGVPLNGFLLDVSHHLFGDLRHSGLGVSVSSRGVAVDRTEVTVAVDQGITQGEVLGHTDHGVVNRCVAVGMVAAQHVADGGGRLAVGAVGGQMVLIHGVEDTAVYRLEAVAYIGQRTGYDDAHGIVDEGGLHFLLQLDVDDLLIFKTQIFAHKSPCFSGFWFRAAIGPFMHKRKNIQK